MNGKTIFFLVASCTSLAIRCQPPIGSSPYGQDPTTTLTGNAYAAMFPGAHFVPEQTQQSAIRSNCTAQSSSAQPAAQNHQPHIQSISPSSDNQTNARFARTNPEVLVIITRRRAQSVTLEYNQPPVLPPTILRRAQSVLNHLSYEQSVQE